MANELKLRTVTIKFTGTSPLLMSSAQKVDPTHPLVQAMKAITSKPAKGKNAKTEDDMIELQRLEFLAGLYWDDDLGVYIPSQNIEGVIRDGAKVARKGKATEAGLHAEDSKLIYPGRRNSDTPDALWEAGKFKDTRSVVVSRSRVMRTRPMFTEWSFTTTVTLFSLDIKESSLVSWLEHAGMYVGLGDYRPKFGRFTVEVIQ